MENVYGISALIFGIIGAFAYIRDSYLKKTKPHRFAWFIFLIISIISFASQFALGAKASLYFAGWFVCNNIIVLSLSFRKDSGYGGVTKINIIGLALAIIGIIFWQILSSPLVALISVLIAEIIGAIMIVAKSFKDPQTETIIMWVLGTVASLLNIFAVGRLDWALLAFPIYLFVANITIVSAIILGRKYHPNKNPLI